MLSSTAYRVPENTADAVNERICRQTEEAIAHYRNAGPAAIDRRLVELDREWDIERSIETEAAFMVLLGMALGTGVSRKLLLLPAVASGMLLLHNLEGWYPLLPLFRRLGIRTQREINAERYALKALRGDFDRIQQGVGGPTQQAQQAAQAART